MHQQALEVIVGARQQLPFWWWSASELVAGEVQYLNVVHGHPCAGKLASQGVIGEVQCTEVC